MPQRPVDSADGHEARIQEDLARSTAYFPAVGLIVGACAALVFWIATRAWHPTVAVVLAVAATVWITGAFHEDALADAFDGLGGGWSKEQILSIMKDSRIGSYGAVALVLMLIAKIAVLASMDSMCHRACADFRERPCPVVQPAADAALRLCPRRRRPQSRVRAERYARQTPVRHAHDGRRGDGRARDAADRRHCIARRRGNRNRGCGAILFSRIGGITGDCLGAANQLVELGTYLVLAAHYTPS